MPVVPLAPVSRGVGVGQDGGVGVGQDGRLLPRLEFHTGPEALVRPQLRVVVVVTVQTARVSHCRTCLTCLICLTCLTGRQLARPLGADRLYEEEAEQEVDVGGGGHRAPRHRHLQLHPRHQAPAAALCVARSRRTIS